MTQLKRIEGIMDQHVYHKILQYRAIPDGLKLLGKGFTYQEDNDPKHSSHKRRNYLERKERDGKIPVSIFYNNHIHHIDFLSDSSYCDYVIKAFCSVWIGLRRVRI